MDSRALVTQMQQIGLWPDDVSVQSTIVSLCQQHSTDPRSFARELLQRNVLTAYQVNALFTGKADQLVVGPYIIQERLGEGGMGQVFKAQHRRMHNIVALKVIRPERIANAVAVFRFHREVRAAEKMDHPHIVRAFDADKTDNTYYLAMEYIKGVDLSSYVKHHGPLPVNEACRYLSQTASGLQHIHEHGLVHRDIKPGNLFLEELASIAAVAGPARAASNLQLRSSQRVQPKAHYQIRILDLGLARLNEDDLRAERGSKLGLTQEGSVMGTADYMAPEQARDSRQADIRSDIYSLGCAFYFALAGQVPFPGGGPMEKMLHHQLDEPAPVEKFRPDLPAMLPAILRRMMAKQADQRYQTPAEIVAAVAPWCGDGDGPPPTAIPLDAALQPTLSDIADATGDPVVVLGPHHLPHRSTGLLWLGCLVLMVTGVALAAVGLFAVLLKVIGK
jgi:serine/threonine protein kinase